MLPWNYGMHAYLPNIDMTPQITQLIKVIPTLPDPMATLRGEMKIPAPADTIVHTRIERLTHHEL